MSSLMMCSGQGGVVQRKERKKSMWFEDIRNKSSHSQSKDLERFLDHNRVFRPFLLSNESISCCPLS